MMHQTALHKRNLLASSLTGGLRRVGGSLSSPSARMSRYRSVFTPVPLTLQTFAVLLQACLGPADGLSPRWRFILFEGRRRTAGLQPARSGWHRRSSLARPAAICSATVRRSSRRPALSRRGRALLSPLIAASRAASSSSWPPARPGSALTMYRITISSRADPVLTVSGLPGQRRAKAGVGLPPALANLRL